MRTIKFRGVDINGETHYGDLVQSNFGILPATHCFILRHGYQYEVKPDTVAQLVFVDKDDQEYYEGDTMTKDGRKWRVELRMYWMDV